MVERKDNCLYRPNTIAEKICIWPNARKRILTLGLWPGVTVGQSLNFFDGANQENFWELVNLEWQVVPHLCIKRIQSDICKTKTNFDSEQYWNYFYNNRCQIGQHNALDFNDIVNQWQKINLLTEDDTEEVNRAINQGYDRMRISPGYYISRDLSLDLIIKWEDNNTLIEQMITMVNQVLQVWQDPIV